METRPFGEYELSRLMLGTVQFGLPYGVANRTGQPGYDEVRAIVAAALEGGVNCFDTAAAYGTSEEVLGRVFHELGVADRVVVVTKVRWLTPGELSDSALAAQAIEQSVAESRRRLRLDCLPVVLFHIEPDGAHLPALERLKARGWLRHAGVSCDNRPGLAAKYVAGGLSSALQLPGNVLDQRHQRSGVFRQAAARGVAVFIRSVYLQGLLVMPEAMIPPALRVVVPIRRRLAEIGGEAGLTLPELALRYMLSQDGVTCILTGVETVAQIRENIALFNRGPLTADLLAAVDAAVPDLPESVLTPFFWPKPATPAAGEQKAKTSLIAGSAVRDISPTKPMFLVGYPHVPRTSTGVHDPLLASALYIADGRTELLLIGADILFISQRSALFCREAISRETGIPAGNIVISASHTHSGPVTSGLLIWSGDPMVPPVDPEYMERFHRGIIEAGVAARAAAEPARLAVTSAVANGVGCNRLNPDGPFDPEVGLLALRSERDGRLFALDLVYGMHPTVLHEDSKLVSSDFPHFTRRRIEEAFPGVTTVYHNGPAGNLSTRYHVKGQTFAEAERLGRRLGESVVGSLLALKDTDFSAGIPLAALQKRVELVPNRFLSVAGAEAGLDRARQRHEQLKRDGSPHGPVRTAECVVFGAEMALALARAQASGEVARRQADFGSAEVQVLRLGELCLVALPGEQFVEYGLEIKRRAPRRSFVIGNSNAELQGYIVTPEAAAAGGYEAAWALFRPESGARMVDAAVELMKELPS